MLCALAANARKRKGATMGTTAPSPVAPTTSAQQDGSSMSPAQRAEETEVLRILRSRYAQWGDTQQWDKFGSLFHDDALVVIDAGPRPNPEADPRVEIHGREAFIAAYTASLDGVHTAHDFFLPEITIDDETHAR